MQDKTTDDRDRQAQLLQNYLHERSEPCPSCGYDLRSLTGHACPECGELLRLRVGLEQPKLAAFVTGIIGIACSLGFSGMFLIAMFIQLASNNMPPSIVSEILVALLPGLVVSGLVLWVWLRVSAWIRRQDATRRWTLAGLCWALPFVNVVYFIVVVD